MRHMNRIVSEMLVGVCLGLSPGLSGATPADGCAGCHGKDGASTEADVPVIGGVSAGYLREELEEYAAKKRPCAESKYRAGDKGRAATDMCKIAMALGKDTDAVAKGLAGKPFVRFRQSADAGKAATGKKVHEMYCEKCHSEGGSAAADDSGVLTGQPVKYLQATFKEYSDGSRHMPKKMKEKWDELKPADQEALIQYYASFK